MMTYQYKNIVKSLIIIPVIMMLLLSTVHVFAETEDYDGSGDELFRFYSRFSDVHVDLGQISNEILYPVEPTLYGSMLPFISSHLFKFSAELGFNMYEDIRIENEPDTPLYSSDPGFLMSYDLFAGIKLGGTGFAIHGFVSTEYYNQTRETTADTTENDVDLFSTGFNIPMGFKLADFFSFGMLFGINYMTDLQESQGYQPYELITLNGGIDFMLSILDFIFVQAGIYAYGYKDLAEDHFADLLCLNAPITAGLNLLDMISVNFQYSIYAFIPYGDSTDQINQELTHKISAGAEVWIPGLGLAPRIKFVYWRFFEAISDDILRSAVYGRGVEKLNVLNVEIGVALDLSAVVLDFKTVIIPEGLFTDGYAMKFGAGIEF